MSVQILLKVDDKMAARIAKAAKVKGVTRQQLIAGVLDGLLPPATAGVAKYDIPLPGFPK